MSAGVALIGIGRWGERIAAAAERAGLPMVTCFARDAEARAAFAARSGCEAAPSLEAAIEHPGVEGVPIVTPNDVHAEPGVAAAERGRHVFVEKPIADTVAAADGRCIREGAEPETGADAGIAALRVVLDALAGHAVACG
jgi:predicted dehydrogenase